MRFMVVYVGRIGFVGRDRGREMLLEFDWGTGL